MTRNLSLRAFATLAGISIAASANATESLLDQVLDSNDDYRHDIGAVGYLFESAIRLPVSDTVPEPCNIKQGLVIGDDFEFRSRTTTAQCENLDAKVGPVSLFVEDEKVLIQRAAAANWREYSFPAGADAAGWNQFGLGLSVHTAQIHSVGFRLPSHGFPLGPRAQTLSADIRQRIADGWTVECTQTSPDLATIDLSHPTKGSIHVEMDELEYFVPTLVLRFDNQGGLRQRIELSYETATNPEGHTVPVCIYANFEAHSPDFVARGGNSLTAATTTTVSEYQFIDSPTGSGTGEFALERPMPAQVATASGYNLISP